MRGWEIRGDCALCGQATVLGYSLLDDETEKPVFWCCGCIDERSDWVIPEPTPGEETGDEAEGTEKPRPETLDEDAGSADAHPAYSEAPQELEPPAKRARCEGPEDAREARGEAMEAPAGKVA
uniref:Uncharacterized protein n=1 Tax=Alexandrium andersonii TaxID=327968 RepID=A0A7S2HJY3_9DINO